MKKPTSSFFAPARPLLGGYFLLLGTLLLGGCYYPYGEEEMLAQPVATSYYGYYSYGWPGYYSPYYYDSFWWSRPSYYSYPYYNRPRYWRPAPAYRPSGPRYQPGWQNSPGGPGRPNFGSDPGFRPRGPAFVPNNQGFGYQPANPGFRSPGGGPSGGPSRPFMPNGPMPGGGRR